jgi:hypothetical protein
MIARYIKKWKLKVENLIEINLKLKRERQTIEYQAAEHPISKENITINKL